MIKKTSAILIMPAELTFIFMSAPGPGGQNVNKVATAALLRFNVLQSQSLPEAVRARLIALLGKRLTSRGELIIKASRFRTQARNKQDALDRLDALIHQVLMPPKSRKKTKPTAASVERRLNKKKRVGQKKYFRRDPLKE